ncbi:MAG: hypothetical protein HZA46_02805 [Planctomycetales bacterium]|nr:hypothetical protein [Planctomycetales bacterium]
MFTEPQGSPTVLVILDRITKGGVVMVVRQTMSRPVKCVGVGKQREELELFDPDQFVGMLLE